MGFSSSSPLGVVSAKKSQKKKKEDQKKKQDKEVMDREKAKAKK